MKSGLANKIRAIQNESGSSRQNSGFGQPNDFGRQPWQGRRPYTDGMGESGTYGRQRENRREPIGRDEKVELFGKFNEFKDFLMYQISDGELERIFKACGIESRGNPPQNYIRMLFNRAPLDISGEIAFTVGIAFGDRQWMHIRGILAELGKMPREQTISQAAGMSYEQLTGFISDVQALLGQKFDFALSHMYGKAEVEKMRETHPYFFRHFNFARLREVGWRKVADVFSKSRVFQQDANVSDENWMRYCGFAVSNSDEIKIPFSAGNMYNVRSMAAKLVAESIIFRNIFPFERRKDIAQQIFILGRDAQQPEAAALKNRVEKAGRLDELPLSEWISMDNVLKEHKRNVEREQGLRIFLGDLKRYGVDAAIAGKEFVGVTAENFTELGIIRRAELFAAFGRLWHEFGYVYEHEWEGHIKTVLRLCELKGIEIPLVGSIDALNAPDMMQPKPSAEAMAVLGSSILQELFTKEELGAIAGNCVALMKEGIIDIDSDMRELFGRIARSPDVKIAMELVNFRGVLHAAEIYYKFEEPDLKTAREFYIKCERMARNANDYEVVGKLGEKAGVNIFGLQLLTRARRVLEREGGKWNWDRSDDSSLKPEELEGMRKVLDEIKKMGT